MFGGTAARKALGFAEVSITIDNSERKLEFENDSVTITRRYYRSGESEYLINKTAVRLKDIHELFMNTGLGRDGYSMIGQGKIDAIVASKSEDRRDIFEEAAGISRFRYRKTEAERKLFQAEENLLRLRDIVSELEGRIGPLGEQSEKAKRFLEYAGEKRELEIGLWLHMLSKSKDTLRDQDYKITLSDSQYKQAEDALSHIEQEIDSITAKTQMINVKIDEIRRQSALSEEDIARTEGEIAVFHNTIFHNNETIGRIEREIGSTLADDRSIDTDIQTKTAAISENRVLIDESRKQLDEVMSALENLTDENTVFSQQIEEKTKHLNYLTQLTSEEKVQYVTAETKEQELLHRAESIDSSIAALSASVSELSAEEQALQSDFQHAETEITDCTNAVKGYEYKYNQRKEKLDSKKAELDRLSLDIGEKSRRATILEDLERSMEGFSYAVKAVTKEAERNGLRGIHGPISRLIKVEEKYSVAVEIALGAGMQNVVTDTEDDAKKAINFLKSNKVGRCTFLPISSIKGMVLNEKGLSDCLGFVGIACELIGYDSKYQHIMNSLLGRTAVAEDMDSAVAIARKFSYRFRIVTLDGQLVNAGGSLTGGSLSKNAGLLNRANEIEKLRNQAGELQKKAETLKEQYNMAGKELSSLEAELVNARSVLITANEDKIRLQGEQKRIGEQLHNLKNQLELLQSEQQNSARRLEDLSKQKTAAEEKTKSLQEQIEAAETELESITGGRDELRVKREALSEQSSHIRLTVYTKEKEIETLETAIRELGNAKENRSGKLMALQQEIEEYKAKNQLAEQSIDQLKNKTASLSEQAKQAKEEVERLNGQRNEIEQKSYQLRVLEREKTSEREKISGELARLQERKAGMLKEYDEIINKLYDEYELTRREAEETGITIEDPSKAQKRLNELKNKIKALGSVNLSAIEEYDEVSQRYAFMSTQIKDIETSRDELSKLIYELTNQMKNVFTEQFNKINTNFASTFKELFAGGVAELRMTDPQNVLASGIEIIVQPPGKNISIIEQLSGGEKSLIAVAIYFAIMKVNSPPFCLLDEVEAALDEANVDRFAEYLRRMSGNTQFIIITHRRGTMEEADILYGVTMQEKGVSKLLQLNVAEIEKALQS